MQTFALGSTVRIKPAIAAQQEFVPAAHHKTGHVVDKPEEEKQYPYPNTTFVEWHDGVFSVQTDWLELV